MTPDELHMRRALDLARAGVGLVSPNPAVGAVVVDAAGNEAGTGTHTYDGVKHAEVLALEQAGARARGGSLFLNLEPCSHQGRTGPCADAILAAGIQRVVASIEDPNPRVAGAGFAKLRAAGVEVEVGLFEAEAKKLNESFAKYIRHGTPMVTLKSAMTLDGKIAPAADKAERGEPAGGGRAWITGEAARAHVQQLRHQHDAILVGVGTVIADDPLLTDRSGLPRRRRLLRVVLDSHLRIPLTSRVVQTAEDDVLVVYVSAEENSRQALKANGVRVAPIPGADGRPDFAAVLRRLGELEITSLLVEGGATVNSTALSAGVVDKLFLYYAPKILGEGSVPFAVSQASGAHHVSQHRAIQAHHLQLHQFGEDFAVEAYLKDPYQG
jgi:diaminohydroxyphosphoribosylaminopyrimidine deaminase/5-amino-6-(5-phosphoribosylamino)uracil reductase